MKDTFRTSPELESAPVRLRASKQEFLLVISLPYREGDLAGGGPVESWAACERRRNGARHPRGSPPFVQAHRVASLPARRNNSGSWFERPNSDLQVLRSRPASLTLYVFLRFGFQPASRVSVADARFFRVAQLCPLPGWPARSHGYGSVIAGFGDQREVELLVEAGFTPLEAIHIATSNGAEFLGERQPTSSCCKETPRPISKTSERLRSSSRTASAMTPRSSSNPCAARSAFTEPPSTILRRFQPTYVCCCSCAVEQVAEGFVVVSVSDVT
jgi:hypothetical protein